MLNSSAKVYALHGFLGLPKDWDGYDVEAVEIKPSSSLRSWAKAFNQKIALEDPDSDKFLLGYSMGGRLALHLLDDAPDLWQGAVLVSTNRSTEIDLKRVESDYEWARRFEEDPWYEVVAAWMDQPVFRGSRASLRLESDFSREELASFLRNFSPGKPEPLSIDPEKVLWVIGEKDEKFVKMQPDALVLPHAGHRVMFDNPNGLKKILADFIAEKNIRQLSIQSIH